ncbi:hypothetical protein L1049_000445 [Liquidambar formosana]|uniref:25S rRNA (uridine-N(3))-methyltransferase BMT5-like domain-containing protein n=1 Tax=Liquidambar formosana TaxID=63359 RepID=A0AAP0NBG3_LIQFO
MGQVFSSFIRCVCGESEEEERPIEQNLLISPPISDSCSSTIQVVKNKQVSPPFPDLNAREPRVEDQENGEEKLITSEEVGMKERWRQHCSSSHSIQLVEDNWQVSPPFPVLNTKEPREEDQAKEEDNEEEKLIISEEVARKETRIQHYISFHSIQLVEDNMQVSSRFPEKLEDNNEEVKLIISKEVVIEGRWIQHYCSSHKMLLVGEGDFSFSASLAVAFGSATNMVATSLDSTVGSKRWFVYFYIMLRR